MPSPPQPPRVCNKGNSMSVDASIIVELNREIARLEEEYVSTDDLIGEYTAIHAAFDILYANVSQIEEGTGLIKLSKVQLESLQKASSLFSGNEDVIHSINNSLARIIKRLGKDNCQS